jgi:hypothetical protein
MTHPTNPDGEVTVTDEKWDAERLDAAIQDFATVVIMAQKAEHGGMRKELKQTRERIHEIARLLSATQPPAVDREAVPVEVWHGERKVTIYEDCVLRVWGENIESQMSDAPRTLQTVQDAMDWLYAAPLDKDASKPAVAMDLSADQRQAILHQCRLYLDDDCGKYNARSVLTHIFSIAASPAASAQSGEPRNVEGMTRAEFESHLRVCFQHDNVLAHVNASNGFRLTDEQEREVTKRADLNYPSVARCPGCAAFDSNASEVHFVHGCEGCKVRMQKVAGFGPLSDPRAASTSANVAQGAETFPYQKTFDAIAAATSISGAGQLEISVIRFREAFGTLPSNAALTVDARDVFIRDVADQKPEKPDWYSTCGQCENNIDRAQEIAALTAAQSASGDAK